MLSSGKSLKREFYKQTVNKYFFDVNRKFINKFPTLSKLTLNLVLSFCNKYLCEAEFSTLTILEEENRIILQNVKETLTFVVINNHRNFNSLCK